MARVSRMVPSIILPSNEPSLSRVGSLSDYDMSMPKSLIGSTDTHILEPLE